MKTRCCSCGAPRRDSAPSCCYCGTLWNQPAEASLFRPGQPVLVPMLDDLERDLSNWYVRATVDGSAFLSFNPARMMVGPVPIGETGLGFFQDPGGALFER